MTSKICISHLIRTLAVDLQFLFFAMNSRSIFCRYCMLEKKPTVFVNIKCAFFILRTALQQNSQKEHWLSQADPTGG